MDITDLFSHINGGHRLYKPKETSSDMYVDLLTQLKVVNNLLRCKGNGIKASVLLYVRIAKLKITDVLILPLKAVVKIKDKMNAVFSCYMPLQFKFLVLKK